MSLTLLGCVLVVSSAAISALLVFRLRSVVAGRDLLSRLRSSSWRSGQSSARVWIVPVVAFLLIAGVGAAVSTMRDAPETTASGDATSSSLPRSGSNGDMLARLKDYARSAGTEEPAHTAPTGKPLPDVNTMIERLAARLETAPDDIKGWRMLGWSYFNTGSYEQAVAAYAKAVALDPNSSELKLSYEEAKAKASGAASTPQAGAAGNGDNPHVAKGITPEAIPPTGQDAAIRAMVDGLAGRLESSPHDVDGWTRLMRSRVVLGEKEIATTAFRKALKVFKDDQTATGRLTSAAVELGLKAE